MLLVHFVVSVLLIRFGCPFLGRPSPLICARQVKVVEFESAFRSVPIRHLDEFISRLTRTESHSLLPSRAATHTNVPIRRLRSKSVH
jgi:hypothetical protein